MQHNKAGGGSGGYKYKIAVVTHGGAGDAFWSIVKAGAVQAGKDMGDNVTYQSNGDPTQQSQLIDERGEPEARRPRGVDGQPARRCKASVQRAVTAGIPVIVINSGEAQCEAATARCPTSARTRRSPVRRSAPS